MEGYEDRSSPLKDGAIETSKDDLVQDNKATLIIDLQSDDTEKQKQAV